MTEWKWEVEMYNPKKEIWVKEVRYYQGKRKSPDDFDLIDIEGKRRNATLVGYFTSGI